MKLVLPSAYHLAKQLRAGKVEVQRFPDGEHKLRVPVKAIGKSVFLFGTTGPSADDLLDLVFACATLKELGCKVTLLITYFAFARQDKPAGGEAHGMSAVCSMIRKARPDKVIIVNPHSKAVVDCVGAKAFDAVPLLVATLGVRGNIMIVAPDMGALPIAKDVARQRHLPVLVLKKRRVSPTRVVMAAPVVSLRGKNVILVDDMVSTGATLAAAARAVKKAGATSVYAAVCHNVAGKKIGKIAQKIGVKKLVVSDTLPSKHGVSVLPYLI